MVNAVIGAVMIYYLHLEWWWWAILAIAFFIDVFEAGATTEGTTGIENKLSYISREVSDIKNNIEIMNSNKENSNNTYKDKVIEERSLSNHNLLYNINENLNVMGKKLDDVNLNLQTM